MKKKVLLFCFAISFALASTPFATWAVDSIRVQGSYAEKVLWMGTEGDRLPDLDCFGSAAVNASVTMKDMQGAPLDIAQFNESTTLSISIGGSYKSFTFSDAEGGYAPNKRSLTFLERDWETGKEIARLTVSWTETTLTIAGTAKYDALDFASLVGNFEGATAKISNYPIQVEIILEDFYLIRPVFLNGSVSRRTQDEWDLTSIAASGSADLTPPIITLKFPTKPLTVTNDNLVTFSGTLKDNIPDSALEPLGMLNTISYAVLDYLTSTFSDWITFNEVELSETNTWALDFTPAPGTNFVYIRGVDGSGNVAIASQTVFYSKKSRLTLVEEGPGTVTGVTNNQWLEIGRHYTVSAKATNASYVFACWFVGRGPTEPVELELRQTFKLEMQEGTTLTACFEPNPYSAIKGNYSGLFFNEEPDTASSGAISMTVLSNGTYSGKLTMVSDTYSFSGNLGLEPGNENFALLKNEIKMKNLNIWMHLDLDLNGSAPAKGFLKIKTFNGFNWNWTEANVRAELLQANQTPQEVGFYNLGIGLSEGEAWEQPVPGGVGYGSVNIKANGSAALVLNLADNIATTSVGAFRVRSDGAIPFFAPLYSKKGFVMGWLSMSEESDAEIGSHNIFWLKEPDSKAKFYSAGFRISVPVVVSRYVVPKAGTNILGWTEGTASYSGGGVDAITLGNVTFNPAKSLFDLPIDNPDRVKLTFLPSIGLVSGCFMPAGTTRIFTFKGAVLANSGAAAGFFSGTNTTGSFGLSGQ